MALRHVELRIRDRTVPAEGDRAFELLRDRSALAAFLARTLDGDEAQEAALALSGKDEPARLLVSKQGAPITCLGPGMVTPAPKVPFADVDRHLREQRNLFGAQKQKASDDDKNLNQRPLHRALTFGYRLTRLEHEAVHTLAPLTQDAMAARVAQHLDELNGLSTRVKKWPVRTEKAADKLWKAHTSSCHQLMALAEHPAHDSLCFAALSTGDVQLSARAFWWLVNRPERTLLALEAAAEAGKPAVAGWGALVEIIGMRFASWRARAGATADRLSSHFEVDRDEIDVEGDEAGADLVFLSALPLLLHRYPPREMRTDAGRATFEERMQAAFAEHIKQSRSLVDTAARMGPWVERTVELLDPRRHWSTEQGWPLRSRGGSRVELAKPERVRLILWRSAVRDLRRTWLGWPVGILAYLSAAPVEALLAPDRPDPVWRIRAGREYVRELLPLLLGG